MKKTKKFSNCWNSFSINIFLLDNSILCLTNYQKNCQKVKMEESDKQRNDKTNFRIIYFIFICKISFKK